MSSERENRLGTVDQMVGRHSENLSFGRLIGSVPNVQYEREGSGDDDDVSVTAATAVAGDILDCHTYYIESNTQEHQLRWTRRRRQSNGRTQFDRLRVSRRAAFWHFDLGHHTMTLFFIKCDGRGVSLNDEVDIYIWLCITLVAAWQISWLLSWAVKSEMGFLRKNVSKTQSCSENIYIEQCPKYIFFVGWEAGRVWPPVEKKIGRLHHRPHSLARQRGRSFDSIYTTRLDMLSTCLSVCMYLFFYWCHVKCHGHPVDCLSLFFLGRDSLLSSSRLLCCVGRARWNGAPRLEHHCWDWQVYWEA